MYGTKNREPHTQWVQEPRSDNTPNYVPTPDLQHDPYFSENVKRKEVPEK